jgi:hypothetical protein
MANPWDIDWSAQPAPAPPPPANPWEANWSGGTPSAPGPTWGATGLDMLKQVPGSAVDAVAGAGGAYHDLTNLAASGLKAAGDRLGIGAPDPAVQAKLDELAARTKGDTKATIPDFSNFASLDALPGSSQIQSAIEGVTGKPPDPTTTGGAYARTTLPMVASAATGGGASAREFAANLVKWGVIPGVASEAAGQATAGGPLEGPARLAASLAAPVIGGRVATLLPNRNASHARDIAALDPYVTSTAGQATDSETMRTLESVLGSSKINAQQGKQFTQEAFRRVGMDVPDGMEPGQGGTVDRMLTDAGARYDDIAARNTFNLDQQGAQNLNAIGRTFVPPGPHTPDTQHAIAGTLTRVHDLLQAGSGTISGPEYLTLRSNIRAAARGANPQLAEGLNNIVDAMDGAFERGIPTNSPDAGALPAANRNYRNALVLEEAASRAGTDTGKGIITPGNLASAAKAVYGKRTYLRGQDDFSDLANPAVASLARIPDSGTSKRAAVLTALGTVGGGVGYALGRRYNDTSDGNDSPIAGLLLGEGGGTGLAVAALARPLLMNRLSQMYLKNQAMTHTPGLLSLPSVLTAEQGSKGLLSP